MDKKRNEQRTRPILKRFFVTEEENQWIKRRMKEAGVENFSTFTRHMLVDGEVRVIQFEELAKFRQEIHRIGVNVNQVAKQVNLTDQVSYDQLVTLLGLLDEINSGMEDYLNEVTKEKEISDGGN